MERVPECQKPFGETYLNMGATPNKKRGQVHVIASAMTYQITSPLPLRLENNGPATLVFIHQTRILKMRNERDLSLNSSICQRRDLFTIELFPFLSIECL